MPRDPKKFEVTTLPSGVSTTYLPTNAYDWPSIRHLAEKGVGYKTISSHFKGLNPDIIKHRAAKESWLTPMRVKKARQALAMKQNENLRRNGEVKSAAEAYEEIWRERQAAMDETAYNIASKALKGVTKKVAKNLISDAKDLKTVVEVVRTVTGHDMREAEQLDQGPKMAVNVNLLRSTGPDSIEFVDV